MRWTAGFLRVVLVGTLGAAMAWGQTPPPQTLESIHMAGAINFEGGGDYATLSLHTCALKGEFISCDYVLTSHRPQAFNYKYGGVLWDSKLVDNFKIDHAQVRGYFLNGKGQHKEEITLTKDDWVWVVQEFSQPSTDIKSGNIVFSGGRYITTMVEGAVAKNSQ